MLFPESWLRQVVNPAQNAEEIAHILTMAGLEIESLAPVAEPFSGVVLARIESAEPHPDAERLKVCQVNVGEPELLQIVCGAPNARAGLVTALSRIGAVLPGGIKIKESKLRGVTSYGMMCSTVELGLGQESQGIIELNDLVDAKTPLGTDIREVLHLNENIFELKITPNRADCLSIKGIAREVAALTGAPLSTFDVTPVPVALKEVLPVQVDAPDLCGRFLGRVVRGVNAKAKTPEWMRERLERAGQRCVNVLVDISNYVMLELGTPSHFFDFNKLPEPAIQVRWAKADEPFTTLMNQDLILDPKVGVVCSGGQVQAMAGVMGGLNSGVSEDTTDVYIEQAFWHPAAIAGITRRFKLASEAAFRFERGVDFAALKDHLEYLTRLVLEICGGQAGAITEHTTQLPAREPVTMRASRCQKVLGMPGLSVQQMADVFTQLQFAFSQQDGVFTVTPPSWRFDIEIEEDLIEEVARIYGYDNIPSNPPVVPAVMLPDQEKVRSIHQVAAALIEQDYQEVINFSFVAESWETEMLGHADPIRLLNPIASNLSVMRSSLLPGLIDNVVFNSKRQQSRVRVFEHGAVFLRDPKAEAGANQVKGLRQEARIAGATFGTALPEQWGESTRRVDFFDVKNDVINLFGAQSKSLQFIPETTYPLLHPGRAARIRFQGRDVGFVGELHPNWVQALDLPSSPVVFEVKAEGLYRQSVAKPKAYSRQPIVQRDLAVWVRNEVAVQQLLDSIKKISPLVQDVQLFDLWKDSNNAQERSLAFRFSLQDEKSTLEDVAVDHCMQRIMDTWVKNYGVRQR